MVNSIGGDLEGDAGNDGYSSEIHGIISFAGGINDLNWIDSNDEPLVCVQGDNDGTVSYNCAPGLRSFCFNIVWYRRMIHKLILLELPMMLIPMEKIIIGLQVVLKSII